MNWALRRAWQSLIESVKARDREGEDGRIEKAGSADRDRERPHYVAPLKELTVCQARHIWSSLRVVFNAQGRMDLAVKCDMENPEIFRNDVDF